MSLCLGLLPTANPGVMTEGVERNQVSPPVIMKAPCPDSGAVPNTRRLAMSRQPVIRDDHIWRLLCKPCMPSEILQEQALPAQQCAQLAHRESRPPPLKCERLSASVLIAPLAVISVSLGRWGGRVLIARCRPRHCRRERLRTGSQCSSPQSSRVTPRHSKSQSAASAARI